MRAYFIISVNRNGSHGVAMHKLKHKQNANARTKNNAFKFRNDAFDFGRIARLAFTRSAIF